MKRYKTDLFQFYYDTKPIFGDLAKIIDVPSKEEVRLFVKTSLENLYHAATHSFLHSNNNGVEISEFYKTAFFILQAKCFIEKDVYIPTKSALKDKLYGKDAEILEICINVCKGNCNFKAETLYKKLIDWILSNIAQV